MSSALGSWKNCLVSFTGNVGFICLIYRSIDRHFDYCNSVGLLLNTFFNELMMVRVRLGTKCRLGIVSRR